MVPELVVAEAEVHGLAGLNARETAHAHREVFIRIGPIDHPPAVAGRIARRESEAARVLREIGVLEADEVEFAFFRELGRRHVAVPDPAAESSEALRESGCGEESDRNETTEHVTSAGIVALTLSHEPEVCN